MTNRILPTLLVSAFLLVPLATQAARPTYELACQVVPVTSGSIERKGSIQISNNIPQGNGQPVTLRGNSWVTWSSINGQNYAPPKRARGALALGVTLPPGSSRKIATQPFGGGTCTAKVIV